MRILITGSRGWEDHLAIHEALTEACYQRVPVVVVHGGCPRGADAIASWWVRQYGHIGVTEEAHPADWSKHGRAAGPIRNAEMVKAGADVCLAFIRDGSPGATGCARLAEQAGIPTWRYTA